jgi:hypothetical protein
MKIRVASKDSRAILFSHLNSRGYHAYWNEYGIYSILTLGVLY